MSNKKVFFENLDFLRFVACSAVFFTHTIRYWIDKGFLDTPIGRLLKVPMMGHEGVSFFFVLSGFLITYLLLAEQDRFGKINLRSFYIRRFLRIWPLYFAVVLIGFFLYPALDSIFDKEPFFQPHSLAHHLVFLSNFDLINLYHDSSVNTDMLMLVINWSVSIEEQFYLLWPLALFILPVKRIWLFWTVLLAVSLLFLVQVHPDTIQLRYHSLSAMGKLVTGGLIAWLAFYSKAFVRFFRDLPRYVIVLVYGAGLAFLAYGDWLLPGKLHFVFNSQLMAAFYAFVILEQNYSHHSVVKYARFRTLSELGKYTYGFYLLHPVAVQLLISTAILFGMPHDTQLEYFWFGMLHTILAAVLTLGLGLASYKYFEKPFLNLKTRFTRVKNR